MDSLAYSMSKIIRMCRKKDVYGEERGNAMPELSLCMIVRDEEAQLSRCLESVRNAVDEMIIVDTGSRDKTKEIARMFGAKVYDLVWQDDFSAARNLSFSYATKPFILWLDADDVLLPDEAEKLVKLKEELDECVDAVTMPYQYAFDDKGNVTLVFDRERIVRRGAGFAFAGRVHEAIAVSGNVIHADIAVRHMGRHGGKSNRRNLAIYEKWTMEPDSMAARDWYYYARELKNAGEHERAVQIFDRFLQMEGWVENRIDAYVQRGECLKALGMRKEARESFLHSFLEAAPRAHALCALGACAMEDGDNHAAVFWYHAALLCSQTPPSGAFVSPDACGYWPLMQLCVCYDKMGLHRKACAMNEQALLLRPDDPSALKNRVYFSGILRKAEEKSKQNEGREA